MYVELVERYVKQARIQIALPAITSFLIGYSSIARGLDMKLIAPGLAIFLLIVFVNLQNDLVDYKIDKEQNRPSPLIRGEVSSLSIRNAAFVSLTLSISAMLLSGEVLFIALFLVMLLLCMQYNFRPLKALRLPKSSIFVLGLVLSLLPSYAGALMAHKTIFFYYAILFVGLFIMRMSTSVLKDYKDYNVDKKFDKNTFLVAYGPTATKRISAYLYVLGAFLILYGMFFAVDFSNKFKIILLTAILLASWLGFIMRIKLSKQIKEFNSNEIVFYKLFKHNGLLEIAILLCFIS